MEEWDYLPASLRASPRDQSLQFTQTGEAYQLYVWEVYSSHSAPDIYNGSVFGNGQCVAISCKYCLDIHELFWFRCMEAHGKFMRYPNHMIKYSDTLWRLHIPSTCISAAPSLYEHDVYRGLLQLHHTGCSARVTVMVDTSCIGKMN